MKEEKIEMNIMFNTLELLVIFIMEVQLVIGV